MYSFDVFGSITAGLGGQETGFYAFLQTRLQDGAYTHIPPFIRNNFASLRQNAKKMADRVFRTDGRECVSLEQIYEVLAATVTTEGQDLQEVKDLECMELVRSVIGIDTNIRFVQNLIAEGQDLIFLADTVYSGQVIRQILNKCSADFANVPCYCSCEWGKLQKTGSLFWKINQVTGVPRADWMYFSMSQENRMQAQRVGLTLWNPEYTTGTFQKAYAGDYVTQQMQRLTLSVIPECKNEKERIGCCIGAPILLAYVEWLLESAKQLRLNRLFFVARDGHILKKLADLLIRQRKLSITTFYLYGSRKAWRVAAVCKNGSDLQELLRHSQWKLAHTYGEFAGIFGLSVEELAQFLPLQGICQDTALQAQEREDFACRLQADNSFFKYLTRKHRSARELLKRYLKQEIGTENQTVAFVEWAGSGYTLECLAGILKELGIKKTINLYFKMECISSSGNCRNYLFWPHHMKNSAITELLCHSCEGQTLGYIEKNAKVIPLLDEMEGHALKAYGYDDYINGIMLTAEKYSRYLNGFLGREGSVSMVNAYMEKIEKNPDRELLLFLTKMPYGITGRETTVSECAPVLTREQLEAYDSQGICPKDYSGMFLEYSLRRTKLECPQLAGRYRCLEQVGAHTAQTQGRTYE